MKVWKQLMLAGAIVLGAAGLAARFLPSSHAMLDQIGMLGVFDALGLVPAPPSEGSAGDGWGGGGAPQAVCAWASAGLVIRNAARLAAARRVGSIGKLRWRISGGPDRRRRCAGWWCRCRPMRKSC